MCSRAVLCSVAIFVLASSALAQRCSHGTLVDGRCVCTNPHPSATDPAKRHGWAGEVCDIEVHGVTLAGELTSPNACDAPRCGNLVYTDQEVCFYAALPEAWSHLAILMNHTSGLADADLFGFFADSQVQSQYPRGGSAGASFSEESTTAKATTIARKDVKGISSPDSVFLCVLNREVHTNGAATTRGPVDFTLYATTSPCPSAYRADGTFVQCSTPLGDEGKPSAPSKGCSHGVCQCAEAHQPPPNVAVPAGAGFEDCAALVVDNTAHGPAESPPKEFKMSYEQPVGTTYFFKMNVPYGFSQIVALAEVEDTEGASVAIMLRHAALPGMREGEFDARSPFYDHSTGMNDRYVSQLLDSSSSFGSGDWWVGLVVLRAPVGRAAVRYDLAIEVNECENDCNGHGDCQTGANGFNSCSCQAGYFNSDCSGHTSPLRWDAEETDRGRGGVMSYWQMPPEVLESGPLGDFKVVARVIPEGGAPSSPSSATAEVGELLVRVGSATEFPSDEHFTMRHAILNTSETVLHVCDSLVPHNSHLNVGVRLLDPLHNVSYGLKVVREQVCREGSLQPEERPGSHGTCWHKCVCSNGACAFSSSCEKFTCFHSQDQGLRYRVNPTQDKCVQDACLRDVWHDEGGHVCVETCFCPSNGDACALVAGCDPTRFTCKSGFVQVPGALTCIKEHAKLGAGERFALWIFVCVFAACCGWVAHIVFTHGWRSFNARLLWKRSPPQNGITADGYFELTNSDGLG